MVSRLDLCTLEENLKKIDIDISDIRKDSSYFFLYSRAVESSRNNITKVELIRKTEKSIKNLIHKIISRVNPDTNSLISITEENKNSYRILVMHIGVVINNIDTKITSLLNILSGKQNIDTNKMINEIRLESFASYADLVFSDMIYNSLKEALMRYHSIENPVIEIINVKPSGIPGKQDEIKKENRPLEKNEKYYWYLVFSYFFRSSQIIGSIMVGKESPVSDRMKKGEMIFPYNISDLKKLQRLFVPTNYQEVGEQESIENDEPQEEPEEPEEKSEEMEEDFEIDFGDPKLKEEGEGYE